MRRQSAVSARETSLSHFTRTAELVSGDVIRSYSTSFGIATRLLGSRHRHHVRNIYALVRVADEIVDGVASQAGLGLDQQQAALDRYEDETQLALRTGYSSDLVIHAFARTARTCGIDQSLTTPFFESMRTDLINSSADHAFFDQAAHETYVYGSAQVVGLMCLRVFTREIALNNADREVLEGGAKQLGAAFQNINFLRDLGDDTARLGRSYLGNASLLTEENQRAWIAQIRTQLQDATESIALLPLDARTGVRSALALFAHLTDRIAETPAAELGRTRVRVPNSTKVALVASAILTTLREGRR